MSDTNPCQYCGEEYSPQGLPAHERACAPDDAEEPGELEDLGMELLPPDGDVDAPEGLNESDIEIILERDDEVCVRCDGTDTLVIHTIDPDEEQFPQNYTTLCMDCEGELEGLHPRTKRTVIQNGA